MSGPCSRIPVVTAARDLAADVRAATIRKAADLALDNNCTITVVGRTSRGTMVFCSTACCLHRMGTDFVASDVEMLLWAGVPESARRLVRNDGRTAYVMPGARTWQEVARLTWPEASYVTGEGQYASVRRCGKVTVFLHATEAEARRACRNMHPLGANGTCESRHEFVDLGGPTDG